MMDDRTDIPREDPFLMIPISGIWRWFCNWRIKRDLNNIKRYEDTINECNICDSSTGGAPEPN
jgi:hypothetical protein